MQAHSSAISFCTIVPSRRRSLRPNDPPFRSPRIRALIAQSATTYLLLCTFFGIHQATSLLILIALIVIWRSLARRWPILNGMLIGFVRGLMGR